jgi:hypothetical protein
MERSVYSDQATGRTTEESWFDSGQGNKAAMYEYNTSNPSSAETENERSFFPQSHAPCIACAGSNLASLYSTFRISSLALCYKPEGREFDSRWSHWDFSLTYSFRMHYGHGVKSASDKSDNLGYTSRGKGGRCVGLTALPPSSADCLEIWEPKPPGAVGGRSRPVQGQLQLDISFLSPGAV